MTPLKLPPLKLGLSTQDHGIAQACAAAYTQENKRQQAYLNSLAVSVVNAYLLSLGIVTDFDHSRSQQPAAQLLEDVAELPIPGWGVLACRPVLADETHCYLPPSDATKALAIQFDTQFRYATLLGFVERVAADQTLVSLDQLQDFDRLLEQMTTQLAAPSLNRLSDWLTGTAQASWQALAAILDPPPLALEPVRSSDRAVERGKILTLEQGVDPVALVVWVEPTPTPELNIAIELWPLSRTLRLPAALELGLLDPNSGEALLHAQARGSDRLRFTFTGEVGDRFDVRVRHQAATVIEPFVI
ncbi:MAG: DUF1822 family protein [Cyanobacteria bacterium P01_G01_bin.54]